MAHRRDRVLFVGIPDERHIILQGYDDIKQEDTAPHEHDRSPVSVGHPDEEEQHGIL